MPTVVTLMRELERTRDETVGYFSLGDADLARTYGPGSGRFASSSTTSRTVRRCSCIAFAGWSASRGR